jgi:8-oxo-dGTP pyrophosphatase MutT (NUDIX family)
MAASLTAAAGPDPGDDGGVQPDPAADPAAEPVAVFDAAGRPTGTRPRGEVYARSLWHAATAVLVRSGDGERVYVHRRSAQKLVMAGLHDCWAGGVLGPGETPEEGAERELAEELGVRGVPLRPLFRLAYDEGDGGLRCHLHAFEVRWDGPVHHQPDEVAEGGWMPVAELRARLADPAWPFVPDGRALVEHWFARRGQRDQLAAPSARARPPSAYG